MKIGFPALMPIMPFISKVILKAPAAIMGIWAKDSGMEKRGHSSLLVLWEAGHILRAFGAL